MRTAAIWVGAALAMAGGAEGQGVERISLGGERAALHNLAGEVQVVAGGGSQVVVEITRGGRDAARLRVQRGEVDGADAVRVTYPGDRVVYPRLEGRGSTSLTVRSDGTFGGGGRWRDGRRVTLVSSGSGTQAWADARVIVPRGRTVSIHQGVGRVTLTNVDGRIRVRTAQAGVSATGTRGALDVDVGSGRVQVAGARGDLSLDTGSGAVQLSDVQGDRLDVDTGSGSVSGQGLRVRSLAVDVGSGRVDLGGVAADEVEVDTGSGSVRLTLARDAERVHVDTGSGSVRLAVPADFGASVSVDTGSGGITVDVPMSESRRRRSSLTGRIGDGRGSVEIDTGSGGVSIVRS